MRIYDSWEVVALLQICQMFVSSLLFWRMNECYWNRVYVENLVNANLININYGSFSSRAFYKNKQTNKHARTSILFLSSLSLFLFFSPHALSTHLLLNTLKE